LLDVREGNRVLDLGAGSGWTTALLAHLVGPDGEVLGVERQRSLLAPARAALAESVPVARAEIREARPGVLGAPDDAPFDRILVSAGARTLPPSLPAQLGEGGILVIPVAEQMRRSVRRGETLEQSVHGAYVFVPLIEGPAWPLRPSRARTAPPAARAAARLVPVHGSPVGRAEREFSNSDRRT